jgi:hypothetical protein
VFAYEKSMNERRAMLPALSTEKSPPSVLNALPHSSTQ